MVQGIYRLDEVADLEPPPGEPRQATASDFELILEWIVDFWADAGIEPADGERLRRRLTIDLESDPLVADYWFWTVDGQPVSMSGCRRPTRNGMSIGPVYTPARWRGRGYASALVAAQSQWILDAGKSFLCLYTDMANPTSNAIYQRIGYVKIGDSAEIRFRSKAR